jgi:hypothetical protein
MLLIQQMKPHAIEVQKTDLDLSCGLAAQSNHGHANPQDGLKPKY